MDNDLDTMIRTELGDPEGRRFNESVLRLGTRKALMRYELYRPIVRELSDRVSEWTDRRTAVFIGAVFRDVRKVTHFRRDESAEWQEMRSQLSPFGMTAIFPLGVRDWLRVGDTLTFRAEMRADAKTNLPGADLPMIAAGAAGFCLQIRARRVSEVFGKRPEDRAALEDMGRELIMEFERLLTESDPAAEHPLP